MKNIEYEIGEQVWVYLADADLWGAGEIIGFTPKRIKVKVTCRMHEYVGNFISTSVKKREENTERTL